MTEELREIGLDVGHRRVDRLMRQNGFIVARARKYKATTDSNYRSTAPAATGLPSHHRSAQPILLT